METTPRQNVPAQDCSKQAILSIALSDTSLVLYPRDPKFGQILSGRSNSFSSNALGLRIGGRLTNRPCMDSAEGDTIVRFRAPGSILIPSKFFHLGRDNLQPPLNRDPWKRQPRQRPSSQESPPVETVASSDTSFILYSPRGKVERISTDLRRSTPLEALPWKPKKLVPA